MLVGLGAVSLMFGGSGGSGSSGLCTNSDGRVIWYTKDGTCSYTNYESCSILRRGAPSGTTVGCTDEQKVAILKKDEVRLIGVPYKTFAETCKENIPQMYDPATPSYTYESLVNDFYFNWGVVGKPLAEACKPFISDELYRAAASDSNMLLSPQCDTIVSVSQKIQCRYEAKTGGV